MADIEKWSEQPLSATMAGSDPFHTTVSGISSRVALSTVSNLGGFINSNIVHGTVGDGVTDDTAALQAAIDAAAAFVATDPTTGPGIVFCPPGTYLLGQITWKDRVWLWGAGPQATVFKAKNGLNTHLFISDGFAGLTGQNKWNAVDGVLSYFGLFNARIDGNKANNSAGDGIRLYAKAIYFGNAQVSDCAANGVYSECGEDPSVSAWPTWPEGNTAGLQTARNGAHGWHIRGPHDIYTGKITAFINGEDGVRVESSSGVYSATGADFTFLHSYSNTGHALKVIKSNVRIGKLRGENCHKEGLVFEDTDDSQIGICQLLDNCRTSGDFQGVIDSSSTGNVISNLSVRRSGRVAAGGFQLSGADNSIDGRIQGTVTSGGNSTGVGLDIASANYANVDVTVSDFSGTGGIGLRTGNGGAINWNKVEAVLRENATQWDNVTEGTNNHYKLTGNGSGTPLSATSVGPNTDDDQREVWDVTLRVTSSFTRRSSSKILHGTTVDLNSTAEQSFTIPHRLIATPAQKDVQLSFSYTGSNTVWRWDNEPYVASAPGVQNVTVKCRLRVAAGAAETGNIIMRTEL